MWHMNPVLVRHNIRLPLAKFIKTLRKWAHTKTIQHENWHKIIIHLGHIICVAQLPIGKTVVTMWVVAACCGTNGLGTPPTANYEIETDFDQILIVSSIKYSWWRKHCWYLAHNLVELMVVGQSHMQVAVLRFCSSSFSNRMKGEWKQIRISDIS